MSRTGAVISAKAKGGSDSASLSAYVHLARMIRFAGDPPGHGHHRSGGDLYRGGDARRAPAAVSSSRGGKGCHRTDPPGLRRPLPLFRQQIEKS